MSLEIYVQILDRIPEDNPRRSEDLQSIQSFLGGFGWEDTNVLPMMEPFRPASQRAKEITLEVIGGDKFLELEEKGRLWVKNNGPSIEKECFDLLDEAMESLVSDKAGQVKDEIQSFIDFSKCSSKEILAKYLEEIMLFAKAEMEIVMFPHSKAARLREEESYETTLIVNEEGETLFRVKSKA